MWALAPQMPRRRVGRQIFLRCARGLSESTELEIESVDAADVLGRVVVLVAA